jgi:hypothetical protein
MKLLTRTPGEGRVRRAEAESRRQWVLLAEEQGHAPRHAVPSSPGVVEPSKGCQSWAAASTPALAVNVRRSASGFSAQMWIRSSVGLVATDPVDAARSEDGHAVSPIIAPQYSSSVAGGGQVGPAINLECDCGKDRHLTLQAIPALRV